MHIARGGGSAPHHQPAHHEAPRHEAPRHEAPRHEAPRHEAPRHEAPRHEAPRHEAPARSAPVRRESPTPVHHSAPPQHDTVHISARAERLGRLMQEQDKSSQSAQRSAPKPAPQPAKKESSGGVWSRLEHRAEQAVKHVEHAASKEVKKVENKVEHAVKVVEHKAKQVEKSAENEIHHVTRKVAKVAHKVEHEADRIVHATEREAHHIAAKVDHEAKRVEHAVEKEAHHIAAKVNHEVKNVEYSVEKRVKSAVHTVEKGVQHAVSGVEHEAKHVEHIIEKHVQNAEHAVEHEAQVIGKKANQVKHEAGKIVHEVKKESHDIAAKVNHEVGSVEHSVEKRVKSAVHTIEKGVQHVESEVEHGAKHIKHSVEADLKNVEHVVKSGLNHVEKRARQAYQSAKLSVQQGAHDVQNAYNHMTQEAGKIGSRFEQGAKNLAAHPGATLLVVGEVVNSSPDELLSQSPLENKVKSYVQYKETNGNDLTKASLGFVKGLGEAAEDNLQGLLGMVTHPGNTFRTIAEDYGDPVSQVITGGELGIAIAQSFNKNVVHGNSLSRGEWAGEATGQALLAVVGTKGLGAVGKLSKISEIKGLVPGKVNSIVSVGKNVVGQIRNWSANLFGRPNLAFAGGSQAGLGGKAGFVDEKGYSLFSAEGTKGTGKALGGAYKDVPSNGGEVHHVPANSISPYSKAEGPGVRMDTEDHRQTASWGNSREARAYRAQQKALIDSGNFEEAQQMDIQDIQSKFGDKYDEGIQQMKDYTSKLRANDVKSPPVQTHDKK